MEKKWLLLGIVVMVVSLCSSAALALDPMGPPVAGLKQGQFSTGVDYSYSKMDLKLNEGKCNGEKPSSVKIKNVKMNKVYANLGYGITNDWEAFLRLGGTNARFDDRDIRLNSDTGFAIGFGTKATFYEEDKLKLGGLFQADWALGLEGTPKGECWSSSDSIEADIAEIQIAVGPSYQLMDGVSIYGGPFFHFIDGDLDFREGSGKGSFDIDETSCFGGYVGAQIKLVKNIPFNIEYQHTAAADALAMSLVWRF